MITPCMVLAETLGKTKISKDEIEEISKIFLDGKTSAKILHEQAEKYIS
jgi:RuvB-like protein 1 (pontin 52)